MSDPSGRLIQKCLTFGVHFNLGRFSLAGCDGLCVYDLAIDDFLCFDVSACLDL